jgi:hypothetical protein
MIRSSILALAAERLQLRCDIYNIVVFNCDREPALSSGNLSETGRYALDAC